MVTGAYPCISPGTGNRFIYQAANHGYRVSFFGISLAFFGIDRGSGHGLNGRIVWAVLFKYFHATPDAPKSSIFQMLLVYLFKNLSSISTVNLPFWFLFS